MTAFADLVRAGKVLYIGVSEWRAEEIAAGAALARELGVQLISNQPQYSMLWRVIEDEVVPTSREGGRLPDRLVAARPGRAHRQVPARASSRRPTAAAATPRPAGSMQRLPDRRRPDPGAAAAADRRRPGPVAWPSSRVAWVLQNPNVAAAIIGASRPSRCTTTSRRPASRLDDDVLKRIDEVLGDVVERDPAKTARG